MFSYKAKSILRTTFLERKRQSESILRYELETLVIY